MKVYPITDIDNVNIIHENNVLPGKISSTQRESPGHFPVPVPDGFRRGRTS